ncbi:MAG: hypothetical protein ACJ75I_04735 [Solirubrobacterales bacterium]
MKESTRSRRGARAPKDSPHETARRGSLEQRARYVSARRNAATSPAHERRRNLGRELGKNASLRVSQKLGFARAEPESLPGAEAVIESALGLIGRIGHEALFQRVKKPMAKGFLPESELDLGSAYMRLALSDEVVAIVSDYLGMIPILTYVDVWYSPHVAQPTWSSQLFHLDHADVTQLKLFLHCSDVTAASGPLTVLPASDSRHLAKSVDYRLAETRVTDETVNAAVGPDRTVLDGPRGTGHFVDTSRCFHFGSRVQAGAPPRQLVVFQYLTPYAFEFQKDYRQDAPYRNLADVGAPENVRLLLGTD